MNTELDKLTELANEVKTEIDNNADDKPTEQRKRKMRFPSDESDAAPTTWVKRGMPRDYGLEELAIGRMILGARGEVLPDEMESKFQSLADKTRKYTMTTTGTGTGEELVETVSWGQLFEDIHARTLVASLFMPYIQMMSKTVTLEELGDAVFYTPAGEGQSITATDLVTAKRNLVACTLKAQVDVSDELSEDAVVNMLASVRAQLIRNAAETIDSVVLNGDSTTGTSNINKYGAAVNGDEDYLLGFDGLIHYPLVEVTGQKTDFGVLGVEDFQTLIGLLGKYADKPDQCAFIIDRGVKNKAIGLSDFKTRDKMGAQATLLTGQIAQIFGVPVILSSAIAKSDVNGRVDGATPANNTLGRMLLINRTLWKVGMRRQVQVKAERSEAKTLTSLVCSMRIGLQCFGDRSDAKYCHTALGYNVTI